MGLFGDKKSNKEAKTVAVKKKEEKEVIKNENTSVKSRQFFGYDVIVFPRVTEKSHNVSHLRQYAFNVKKTSNKEWSSQQKKIIEKFE